MFAIDKETINSIEPFTMENNVSCFMCPSKDIFSECKICKISFCPLCCYDECLVCKGNIIFLNPELAKIKNRRMLNFCVIL